MRWLPFAALAACHAGPEGDGPWHATTVPPDPECTRCVEIGAGVSGHQGEIQVLADTEVDDPVAQWNGCAGSLARCVEQTRDVDACVHDSPCPAVCVDAYEDAVDGSLTFLQRVDVVDAVFFTPSGLCAPPDQGDEVSP